MRIQRLRTYSRVSKLNAKRRITSHTDMSSEHPSLSIQALQQRFGNHYKWIVIVVLAMGIIAAILLSTTFSVAVPALMRYFAVGETDIQLVITVFMVANTIAMLPAPWLVERYGLRRCFIFAVVVLAAATLAGAFSPNLVFFLITRAIQGAVAGVLFSLSSIVVMSLFSADEQGRAFGILGFGMILVPSVAPAIGGLVIDNWGWQGVLLMCLPFCIAAWLGALRYFALSSKGDHGKFDWTGMAALSIMTLAVLGLATSLKDGVQVKTWTVVTAGSALIAMVGFIYHARNTRAIVSIDLLRCRPVAMGMVVSFVYGLGLYGSSYQIPVFLQTIRGFSATQAGSLLLPCGLVLAATLPPAGFLTDRFPSYRVAMVGLALFGISSAALWGYAELASYAGLIWITIVGRVGIGLLSPSLNKAALSGLHGPALGQASMVINYSRMLGGVVGVALLVAFVEWRGTALGGTTKGISQAYGESFILSALVFGISILAAWRMKPSK